MEVFALEVVGDVGQPEERFGGRADRRAEEIDVAEGVVAAGADEQVRRVRRQATQLLAHALRRASVYRPERRPPAGR